MDGENPVTAMLAPPGTERPRRFRPRLRYELIDCGLHGHELLGTDAAALRQEDGIFAREAGGLRWYRCLRCDSWVALTPPADPAQPYPPQRDGVRLPLRGRPLRDRYVLRLVALERVLHFLALSALAAAVLLFASNRVALDTDFTRALKYVQGGLGGPINDSNHGIVHFCSACSRSTSPTCTWSAPRSRRTPPWRRSRRRGCGSGGAGPST